MATKAWNILFRSLCSCPAAAGWPSRVEHWNSATGPNLSTQLTRTIYSPVESPLCVALRTAKEFFHVSRLKRYAEFKFGQCKSVNDDHFEIWIKSVILVKNEIPFQNV